MLPTQSAEFIIHHDIKELGLHILVCSVHYTAATERRYFRKFFKFHVLNPLAVKTKVNSLLNGRVFLEAQIQNLSTAPMCLERMKFDPNDLFDSTDLNTTNSTIPTTINDNTTTIPTVFDHAPYLSPQDTRQYLYMLSPKTPNDPLAQTTSTLGKLDIMWRTSMAQIGRLQTSQLSRKVPPIEPYDINVIKLPPLIVAEHPFTLQCRLRNNLPAETLCLSLAAVKAKMGDVLICGITELILGDVAPLHSVDFELHFFPLLAGLHNVTGLRINEAHSGIGRDVDSLTQVLVS
ncbi:hypothetical protein SeLEV6574_g06550 [Synchytrium endobioticum]|uniref:Trafficking protein particle complex subunit 13 n=1 Tax=Synchytrium endobioticum TaxID=286115 RepID=A0A507CN65_9FUNG|nr:hypothetical protein SeLEV6574_g06550 [Synchytrium endobioticum]